MGEDAIFIVNGEIMTSGIQTPYKLGQKFNQLTLVSVLPVIEKKITYAMCQCDCGSPLKKIALSKVITGKTKSCSCKRGKHSGAMAIAYQIFKEGYADGNLTFDEFLYLTQQECWICGNFRQSTRKRKFNPNKFFCYHGLDRLDNNRVHDKDNVKSCCWRCNELRGNVTISDFKKHISEIYHNICK